MPKIYFFADFPILGSFSALASYLHKIGFSAIGFLVL